MDSPLSPGKDEFAKLFTVRGLRKDRLKNAPFPVGATVHRLDKWSIREVITGGSQVDFGKWGKNDCLEAIRTDPVEVPCGVQKAFKFLTKDQKPIGAAFTIVVSTADSNTVHDILLLDYWRSQSKADKESGGKARVPEFSFTINELSKSLQDALVKACRPFFGEQTYKQIVSAKGRAIQKALREGMGHELQLKGLLLESATLVGCTPLPQKEEIKVKVSS